MTVWIGTSGWQYDDWRTHLYRQGVPKSRWLEHYATRFQTVELNSTFYGLPAVTTSEGWRSRTPEDFVFAVKASRYITHLRFRDPADSVARLMERIEPLGPKLGPILIQLRDTVTSDLPALDRLLRLFPRSVKLAFEPRHDSWYGQDTADLLAERGAAFCLTDTPHRKRPPMWRTADWGYVRFHEGTSRPRPCYRPGALAEWAHRLADLFPDETPVYVYFNNDPQGCAVRDARRFALATEHLGRSATRYPPAVETTVGG